MLISAQFHCAHVPDRNPAILELRLSRAHAARVAEADRDLWAPFVQMVVHQNAGGQDVDLSGNNSGDDVNFTYGGTITDARVGLAAVGPNTTSIDAISHELRGQQPSEELWARAGAIAAESCSPTEDGRGSVAYKRHLADELTRRALRRCVARIHGEEV